MKALLVTGGLGFIGSHFVDHLLETEKDRLIVNIDKMTYAACPEEDIKHFSDHPNYRFVHGDICDLEVLQKIFQDYDIHDVIHLAAESHVDNSISDPGVFIHTNIVGSYNLLNLARNQWMDSPFQVKEAYKNSRFLHVSTDEVFGSLGDQGAFTEDSPYAPNSPYSASKASSDLIARSYFKTYGMNIVISNCTNNYGPRQHNEKLIPVVIRKALSKEPIPIYGDGKNVRDWIFVKDHCQGIHQAFKSGKAGESYLLGTENEISNIKLCRMICSQLDELSPRDDGKAYSEQITFVKDRPGHDWRYAIDPKKSREEIEFSPDTSFENGLRATIAFYLDKYSKA